MSKIVKDDFNKRRHEFIGGSDVAAILGLSPWNTPLSVWAKKTRQISDELTGNLEAVEFGIALEPLVSDKFAERTGKTVTIDNTEYVHKDYPYMRGHIDRRVDGNEVFEAKTCSAYKAGAWEGDEIPDDYYIQLNWYLGLVGDKVGHIACLIGGQKFVYKEIKFDKPLFDKCVESARDFWENYVLTETPPFAVANDKDTLVELFPESRAGIKALRGEDAELEATFNQLALNRLEGKNQIKEIEVEVDESDNLIRQLIGDDEGLETGQYKATWKNQTRKSVDIVRMKEDGIYEEYIKESQTRVLRVVEKKGKK